MRDIQFERIADVDELLTQGLVFHEDPSVRSDSDADGRGDFGSRSEERDGFDAAVMGGELRRRIGRKGGRRRQEEARKRQGRSEERRP